jgi:hypothetical protein
MPLCRRVKLGLVSDSVLKVGSLFCYGLAGHGIFVRFPKIHLYSIKKRYICIFPGHTCQNDQTWSAALFYVTSEFVNTLSVFSTSKR